jgi:hypothetical protein
MKTICWIYDTPGWAYSVRAEAIAKALPQYHHRFVCYPREGFLPLLGADLVVCPDPRILPCFGASAKVVLHINAVKIFACPRSSR